MSFLFELFKNLIIVLFPLVLFKSLDGIIVRNGNVSRAVIFLSLFIGIFTFSNEYFLIFINIPLSVLILKKEKWLYTLSTVIVIIYFYLNHLYLYIIEYLIILGLFLLNKITINIFTAVTIYFFTLNIFAYRVNIFNYLSVIIFYTLSIIYMDKVYVEDLSKKLEDMYSSYLFKFIHEVKNPLSVVLGYLEIINKKDNCDLNKYLMIIDKEVNESLNIIEDYLMYGRFNVNFDYVDINLLLKEVTSDYKKLEKLYDMRLNFYYDEEEHLILGDYSKLKQVVINIIKNSIESHSDKRLEIDIDYKIVNNNIIIDINDNGVGIKDENSLGKEFYTTKENGLGLGVNFSKNIIKLHKGEIKYISKEEKGTDVRITLPLLNI